MIKQSNANLKKSNIRHGVGYESKFPFCRLKDGKPGGAKAYLWICLIAAA
jgi:hypothetical protein